MVTFLGLVSRTRLRPGNLQCVSGSLISEGDAGLTAFLIHHQVYAAAIAAFHASIAGRSVGRECGNYIFMGRQENEASSYSSTMGLTNRTKGPKEAPV